MYRTEEITQLDDRLQIRKAHYQLRKLEAAEAKINTWKDHLLRTVIMGLLCACVPLALTFKIQFVPLLCFAVGVGAALLTATHYELRVRFNYGDETGVQWLTIAKGRYAEEHQLFVEKAEQINAALR
ncbi:hypothetical protein [Ferrimonas pelagia]|uniref:DUF4231 domain-containing protein n=1 Tax=Ferrimonas pelagia TaxID=1177826 RepID=A0ABP9EQJ2_9GAMM